MNAIEIRNLSKSFRGMYAVDHLSMTVPAGAIYGFIGENGSGKSTTEKLICGHLVPDEGEIRLFGRDYTDPGVRVRVGALIENADCRTYVALQSGEMNRTKMLLGCKYSRVEEDEAGYLRVYDLTTPEEIVTYLYENGICVTEIGTDKIGLEEYYIDLMKEGKR